MSVFQLELAEIERYPSLSQEDLGKWCFLVRGCIQGFYGTKEEAEAAYKDIFRN
jgi:hypothetical protein